MLLRPLSLTEEIEITANFPPLQKEGYSPHALPG
jgi:hypothetical protein